MWEVVILQVWSCRNNLLYQKDLEETLFLVRLPQKHWNTETLDSCLWISCSVGWFQLSVRWFWKNPRHWMQRTNPDDHTSNCSCVGLLKSYIVQWLGPNLTHIPLQHHQQCLWRHFLSSGDKFWNLVKPLHILVKMNENFISFILRFWFGEK